MEQFSQIQADLEKALATRQQLEAQLQENEQVLIELKLIKDDGVVYKLVGPAMLKQDLQESRENVSKRIEFIRNEVKKLDSLCKELISKQETLGRAVQCIMQEQFTQNFMHLYS